jgi:hypothetical protein
MATGNRLQPPTQPECPQCGSGKYERLPASVLRSTERWFECRACHRLRVQQRDESCIKQDDISGK